MAYDFNSLTKQADEANNRDKFYTDFSDVDPNKLHQITELTEWMRTKAKGSDVREVIAQLFERTWLENIKEGNANMEVAQARGTHPNLKSRLDESDKKQRQNTAQLAEKANKDEVTNVMTPKGTLAYASLPTSGNQVGWYYYCPDGPHGAGNYVWNGTSWYFGGTGDEGYNLLKKDLSYVVAKHDNKNLIGTDPNVFYPVDIPKGTYITTSSPDEVVLPDNEFIFYGYDENKNMVDSWSIFFDNKGRTICLSDSIDIKYLKISHKPSFRVQLEIGRTATSYSDYNKGTHRLSDFAINEISKKLGMTTTKLSFTRGIMRNNNGYFLLDQTSPIRASSENMYFEKGDVISSINGFHYVNRIELDKNDRIISDNDNYECTTRVIENSGYYRFMIADVDGLENEILMNEVDFVVIKRFNKYIKTATQRFNDNFKCKTVAHTGLLTSEYPRNSKEGFLESAKCDTIWGIETDLQTTSDGVIVCLHDPYHGRLTSGTGIVSQLTWDWQYENIRLSFDYVGTPSEYRICTFDEYLRICKTYGKVPIIDLKVEEESGIKVVHNYEKIVKMLKEYGLEDRAIFTAMSVNFLNGIRQYSENACLLYDDYTYKNPEWIISQYFGRNRNAGMSLNMNYNLTSDEVKNYHKNGLIMCNWTATNTDYQGAIKQRNLGIDFAVCDLIDDILKYD